MEEEEKDSTAVENERYQGLVPVDEIVRESMAACISFYADHGGDW